MAIRGLPLGQAVTIAGIVIVIAVVNYFTGRYAPETFVSSFIMACLDAVALLGIYASIGAFRKKEATA